MSSSGLREGRLKRAGGLLEPFVRGQQLEAGDPPRCQDECRQVQRAGGFEPRPPASCPSRGRQRLRGGHLTESERWESIKRGRDRLARRDEVSHQTLVGVEIALIFAAVANLMAFGKHPPDLGTETERVRKHLKHQVSIRRAVTSVAQRREAESVRSVVDEIEATLQRVRWLLRVGESSEAGLLEPDELLRVRRLLAQGLAGSG